MRTFLQVTTMTVVTAGLVALAPGPSYASHDDDWETAGQVIAGVAAAGVLAAIATGHHADVSVGFSYNQRLPAPPPRCEPPPPRWGPATTKSVARKSSRRATGRWWWTRRSMAGSSAGTIAHTS